MDQQRLFGEFRLPPRYELRPLPTVLQLRFPVRIELSLLFDDILSLRYGLQS